MQRELEVISLIYRLEQKINDIYTLMNEYIEYFKEHKNKFSFSSPHVCPLCEGKGRLIQEDVTHGEADRWKTINCHACHGAAIVWG